ncbi:MAG: DUF4391 domain-containing protein [Oscillospiraceae bacterium]|nr:DUF4391 domain-containing protein [Oscillospiraceae bacterium]
MTGLPRSTEFGKRIPKQKFYENLNISPALKKSFVEQIKIIYWANKIAPSTVNIAEGKAVSEIEVFHIKLNTEMIDEAVLKQIDREIAYHIVFILEYNGLFQAYIGYKEASSGNNAFKVDRYYHTDWIQEDELPLKLEGLDMDTVYENFIRQIAGDALQSREDETIKDSVERDKKTTDIQKQIDLLEKKIRKEKQLNRQMEMSTVLKKLKKSLEDIQNG